MSCEITWRTATLQSLSSRLEAPARAARYASVRTSLRAKRTIARRLIGPAFLVVAVGVAASRFGGVPWPLATAVAGVVIVIGAVVTFAPAFRPLLVRADLADVAERVDHATINHNRIATALDLLRVGDRSMFAAQAIQDGLVAATNVSPFLLNVPGHPRPSAFPWTSTIASAVCLIAAILAPTSHGRRDAAMIAAADPTLVAAEPRANSRADRPDPPDALLPPAGGPALVESVAQAGASNATNARAGKPAAVTRADAIAAMAGAGSSGRSLSARNDVTAGSGATSQNDPADGPSTPATDLAGSASPQPAANASQAADATPRADGGVSGANASSPAGASSTAGQVSDPSANQTGGTGQQSSEGSPGGENSPQQPGSGQQKSNQSQRGQGSSGGESGGDNGKTGGTNSAAKKSRGVAAMMLAEKVSDRLLGIPRAGPVDRTRAQVPSTPMPTEPAANVAVGPAAASERPVSSFAVPGELQGVVGDYFVRLHRDAPDPQASVDRP